jgi:two-component system, cell cycle sensor histidine kinase and response regulator CckA
LADPTQIHQVIMNLCTNASYAMREEGGTLNVKLDRVHIDTKKGSMIECSEEGNYIRLSIGDTG